VDALLIGTGGADGWPADGCSCAACMRARAAGVSRAAGRVVVDSALTLLPGEPPRRAPGRGSGHQIRAVPGGWEITGPDGGRLLAAAGPGQAPEPPDGTPPFDLALLDLLTAPAQLGLLRDRGLVRPDTTVATLYTDHRATSEQEVDRRCALWGVRQGRDGLLVSWPASGDGGQPAGPAAAARPHRTLILGGARSGKSREAELRLAGEPSVTYLAAGPWADESWAGADGEPDAEWAARVAAHRAARPSWWRTEESLDVAGALRRQQGALLIDGIGTWLAAVMDQAGAWAETGADTAAADQVADRIAGLMAAWRQASGLVVAVSDQVGAGLVPPYPAGRVFRDQLGWLNQQLAAESDLVLHVVAGRLATLPA
jgi:adenosylcobinamide kinase / adenosylcobinamide-phosphate guanylyltransferase